MDVTCPACRTPAISGDRFCAVCGARVPAATPTRRPPLDDDFVPLSVPQAAVPEQASRQWPVMLRLALIGLIVAAGLAAAIYVVNDSREPDEQVIAAPEPFGAQKPVNAVNQFVPEPTLSPAGTGTGAVALRDRASMVPGIVTIGGDTVHMKIAMMIPDTVASGSETVPASTDPAGHNELTAGAGLTQQAFVALTGVGLANGGGSIPDAVVLTEPDMVDTRPATRPLSDVNDGTGGAAYHPGA